MYYKEREERKEKALKMPQELYQVIKYQEVFENAPKIVELVEFSKDLSCRLYITPDGDLAIQMDKRDYLKEKPKNPRKAGRRKKKVYIPGEKETYQFRDGSQCQFDKEYRYADILIMMQNMKDKEIMSELNMTQSTYYRRKKQMKNSAYFKNLDKNRLDDKAYLESVEGNDSF